MKCPLITAGFFADPQASGMESIDCLKKDCAWWEQKIGKCAVLRMWQGLQDIHEVLHDIHNKMPPEGQFRPR